MAMHAPFSRVPGGAHIRASRSLDACIASREQSAGARFAADVLCMGGGVAHVAHVHWSCGAHGAHVHEPCGT